MVQILLGILGVMGIWYLVVFAKDYREFKINNSGVDEGSTAAHGGIALGVNFFDTLGIGGFAPMTALFKQFNLVHDRIIPGTLNTAMTIPVIAEAFIFIKKVEVEPITLISMLVAATTLTSVLMTFEDPTLMNSPVSSTLSRRTWVERGNSATSSRKMVPSWADSNRPTRARSAPV